MNIDRFIVKDKKCFPALKKWVKKYKANGCTMHFYSDSYVIWIGHDSNPDSDWSKLTRYAKIIIKDKSISEETSTVVCKALWGESWEPAVK